MFDRIRGRTVEIPHVIGELLKQGAQVWSVNEDEAKVLRTMHDLVIGSGYGRVRVAIVLKEMGIKAHDGKRWHETTVGHILHNLMYTGVLRSGETHSAVFDELQIISTETFQLAQKLMLQRTNEYKEKRTMPLRTSGQSLLRQCILRPLWRSPDLDPQRHSPSQRKR